MKAASERVALVYWGRRGGGARMTAELARAMVAVEGAVSVSVASGNEVLDDIRASGASVQAVTTPRTPRDLRGVVALPVSWVRLLVALWRSRPSLVIVVMGSPWTDPISPAVHRVVRARGGRLARIVHDGDKHPGDRATTPLWMERIAMRHADAFVTLSDHVRATLVGKGIAADRIVRSEHGPFGVGSRPAAAREPHRPFRVLFFGRLAPYKGVPLLVAAARLLDADVEVRIVGDGDVDLGELPASVRLERRWVPESEVGELLGWCDAVALPYVEASQSGVAPMALSAGIPVVVTPVGGLAEQVLDGETGIVAAACDPTALAAAIRSLADDSERYTAMSLACARLAPPDEAWSAIATRLLADLRAQR